MTAPVSSNVYNELLYPNSSSNPGSDQLRNYPIEDYAAVTQTDTTLFCKASVCILGVNLIVKKEESAKVVPFSSPQDLKEKNVQVIDPESSNVYNKLLYPHSSSNLVNEPFLNYPIKDFATVTETETTLSFCKATICLLGPNLIIKEDNSEEAASLEPSPFKERNLYSPADKMLFPAKKH